MRHDPQRSRQGLRTERVHSSLAASGSRTPSSSAAKRKDGASSTGSSGCQRVGFLSEEYDVTARRLVGNYPQAFSHIALINTPQNLTRASKPAEQRAGEAAPGV